MAAKNLEISIPGKTLHEIKTLIPGNVLSDSFTVLVNGVKIGEAYYCRYSNSERPQLSTYYVFGEKIHFEESLSKSINSFKQVILNPKQDEIDGLQQDISNYVKILTNYDGKNRDTKEADKILDKWRIMRLASYATSYEERIESYKTLMRIPGQSFRNLGLDAKNLKCPTEIKFPKLTKGENDADKKNNEFKFSIKVIRYYEKLNGKIKSNEELEILLKEKKIDFSQITQKKANETREDSETKNMKKVIEHIKEERDSIY